MTQSAKDGLIFLLHDFEGNEATVEAVDLIIPILKLRGYRFVTVRELFKKKGIKSQKNLIYTDVAILTTSSNRKIKEQCYAPLLYYYFMLF